MTGVVAFEVAAGAIRRALVSRRVFMPAKAPRKGWIFNALSSWSWLSSLRPASRWLPALASRP
jgi:hypothetical protein